MKQILKRIPDWVWTYLIAGAALGMYLWAFHKLFSYLQAP